jgi:N-terminal phage replisome organiser (Phage_rep_org_N)
MKWFRFYSEFMDDPKIAMMSDSDQLLWVKALCLASESSSRGEIKLTDDEICWKLRITPETWRHAIDKFRAKGMIEHVKNGYKITNWDKRQFESDNTTQRVAKHRASKDLAKQKQPCNVTCNELVTPPEQIQSTDPDSDPKQITDLIKGNTPLIPQGGNAITESVSEKLEVFRSGESITKPSALINCPSNTSEPKTSTKNAAAARRAKKKLLAAESKPSAEPDKFEAWWMIFRGHAQKNNHRPGSRAKSVASWDVLHETVAAGDDLSKLSNQILDGTEAYWQREGLKSRTSVKNGENFLAERDWLEALEWQQLHESSAALAVAPQYAPFLEVWNQDRPMTWPTADDEDFDRDTVRQLEKLIASCNGTSLERFQKALQYVRRDEYWGLERVLTLKEFLYSTRINEWSKKQLHHESLGISDRPGNLAKAAKEAKRIAELNQLMQEVIYEREQRAGDCREDAGTGDSFSGYSRPNSMQSLSELLP